MKDQLEKPDETRCQAEKSNGQNFMTFGGGHKLVRCRRKPQFIATEKKKGSDSKKGSMSLCSSCLAVFLEQMPDGYAVIKEIRHGAGD